MTMSLGRVTARFFAAVPSWSRGILQVETFAEAPLVARFFLAGTSVPIRLKSNALFQTRDFTNDSSLADPPLTVRHGFPVLRLPLPSRRHEAGCEFVIRPATSTVASLSADVREEDPAVEQIYVASVSGERVAMATEMRHLLPTGFSVFLNRAEVTVPAMKVEDLPLELDSVDRSATEEMKDLVKMLHVVLNLKPQLAARSADLRLRLDENRTKLVELEAELEVLRLESEKRLDRFNHFNLFLMCAQFGLFARLTWWEYSWDIMEPVTYFTTVFHSMVLVYGWSVITQKDYLYPIAADHFYLKWLHKLSGKAQFDMQKYNALKQQVHEDEAALRRIRSPIEANFWISPPIEN